LWKIRVNIGARLDVARNNDSVNKTKKARSSFRKIQCCNVAILECPHLENEDYAVQIRAFGVRKCFLTHFNPQMREAHLTISIIA